MTSNRRSRDMDAARVHAELTVQSLWLRYVALGGNGDAFDVDGFLQGLAPLETFEQDILAQALNEALEDSYRAHRVPLSVQPAHARDGELYRIIDGLLKGQPPAEAWADPPRTDPPDESPPR